MAGGALVNVFGTARRKGIRMGVWLGALILLAAWRTFAADSCSFMESYQDKVICLNDGGEESCDEIPTGKFTIKGLFFTDGSLFADSSAIGASTLVTISVGNWTFSDTLGDSKLAKTTSTFTLKGHYTIKLALSSKGLAVSVKASTGTDRAGNDLEDSILASDDDGLPSGPFDETSTEADIEVDTEDSSLTASAQITVAGTVATKSVTGKDGSSFDISKIKITGTSL